MEYGLFRFHHLRRNGPFPKQHASSSYALNDHEENNDGHCGDGSCGGISWLPSPINDGVNDDGNGDAKSAQRKEQRLF